MDISAVTHLRWGPAASLAMHAGLLALLVLAVPQRYLKVAPVAAVMVDLVAPPPAMAETAGPALLQTTEGTEVAEAAGNQDGGTITATNMQAASVLERHRAVREALPLLAEEERMVQLCDIEAIEQINQWRPEAEADTLVAYAFGEVRRQGLALTAGGGAYRSRRAWYRIAFTCTVAEDFGSVTAFAFTPGDRVPEADWDAHYLTAEEVE